LDTNDHPDIPVVILCGGEGTRFGQATQNRPKPLMEIGNEPMLVHIMRLYASQGFKRFILCLGYRGQMIKEYFLQRDIRERDMRMDLARGTREFLNGDEGLDWDITFAETGAKSQTGARIRRIAQYINAPRFMLTYGDGLSDLDLNALLAFHLAHGKIGTLTGVQATSQFGELKLDGDTVLSFVEKPKVVSRINGGFFVMESRFLDYIPDDPDCVLEKEPLEGLSKDGELKVFKHDGFWHCMDTFKDYRHLNEIYSSGQAPWIKGGH